MRRTLGPFFVATQLLAVGVVVGRGVVFVVVVVVVWVFVIRKAREKILI
jgi:hypothetical protein